VPTRLSSKEIYSPCTLALALARTLHAFGVAANHRLVLEGEAAADWLGSDAIFSTWRLALDWQQKTFWKRRWLANTLDLRLLAGTSTGDVPPQRHAVLDVAMGPFTPFGAFRTVHGHPYEARRYAALFCEHNFRTVSVAAWHASTLMAKIRPITHILTGIRS
jgi:hypothetical protein